MALIVWERRGEPIEDHAAEVLIERYPDALGAFRGRPERLHTTRVFLRGILGADGAVFPAADQSCLTIASSLMISRSNNDRGVGAFGACLLGDVADEKSLAHAVREALDAGASDDPLTTAAWPLLPSVTDARPVAAFDGAAALRRPHASRIVEALRQAAQDLATHERAQGNRLRTLERAVYLAVGGTLAHAQAISAGGDLAARIPILLAAGFHKGSEISAASELSLDRIYRRFEEWLVDRLAERIRDGRPLAGVGEAMPRNPSASEAEAVLKELRGAGAGHPPPGAATVEARLAAFREARHLARGDVVAALARALVMSYLTEYVSGGPQPFLEGLGRRSGFLYPHFQGRSREKRLCPNVRVLDALVRACVPAGEFLPLQDFLDRLWGRFGIVVGGRVSIEPTDLELLRGSGIDVDTSALGANVERFVEQLAAIGLARRYADNVTFVGDAYGR
ncbi:MAG TPA: hypothetical protein VNL18_00600 [Gemmatimonadales bacterium]|nr:hypothetical protein [Gemmatimonadales bacterium]